MTRKVWLFAAFVLLPAAGSAPFLLMAAAGEPPRVTRTAMIETEKILDPRISLSSAQTPFLLLGPTRGVYLEGYGAVFTAEVNLVSIPAIQYMFQPPNPKEAAAEHKRKKIARLPELRTALRQALLDAADSLKSLPPQEQVVVTAFLAKYPWEDTAGLPVQIRMQASKKDLIELRKNEAGLTAAIRVSEE